MNRMITATGCVILATLGFYIVQHGELTSTPQSGVRAANVLDWKLDGQNAFKGPEIPEKVLRDGLILPKDTVCIRDTIVVDNTKYVQVPVPGNTTDTVYIIKPEKVDGVSVNYKKQNGDRKVFTPDELPRSKPAEVILIVDGEKVYSSSTVITPVEQPKIFDEPQKLQKQVSLA